MMYHEQAAQRILEELDRTGAPVPVAAALGALGINPFRAAEHQVRFVLEAVQASDRLRLGRIGEAGLEPLPESVSVEDLLDELYRSPEHHPDLLQSLKPGRTDPAAGDRVEAMTKTNIEQT